MKKTLKKLLAVAGAVTMLACSMGSLVACNKEDKKPWEGKEVVVDPEFGTVGSTTDNDDDWDVNDEKNHYTSETTKVPTTTGAAVTDYNTDVNKTVTAKTGTYRTYTTVIPSAWNSMDSMDNNDSQIYEYLKTEFFEFDYKFKDGKKFNADGTINTAGIIEGSYEVKFAAATQLEDWTSKVTDPALKYTDDEKETGGYAWKLTLRDDLKWDNGDPIKAQDFVYSMQQQLNPEYKFKRASSYYDAVTIKGTRDYVYQGQTIWANSNGIFDKYDSANDSDLIFTLGSGKENADYGEAVCYVRTSMGFSDAATAQDVASYLVSNYVNTVTVDQIAALEGKTFAEIKANASLKATWDALIAWWQTDPNEELHFFVSSKSYPTLAYDGNVGLYAISDTELVICYTSSYQFIKEDGSLSYLAGYTLSDLPLVHKATFEANRKAPSTGSTLYTNTYNTTLASTRSWGPYKLTEYQSGKFYKLERNENWYGYTKKDNTNQYNVTAIECEQIATTDTAWMEFLSGGIDSIGIDVTHAEDYRNSKYTHYTPGTYTFSWHLYSDLEGLQQSGRNNTILAIDDFRKALSLAIDRTTYAQNTTTAYQPWFGYLNNMYYYDVENGGVYRQTDEAKSGLLRAYGYTQDATTGLWSLSTNELITNKTLDEAYETLTGYNLELAKQYVEKAYKRLTDYWVYYQYDSSKPIQIKYGTSTDSDSSRLVYNYIKNEVLEPLFKGTSLEGKVELVFDASFGNNWSDAFSAGEYELCESAWGSAAFNPHYFIGCYINPQYAYTADYWDTENYMVTYTLPGEVGEYPGSGKTRTMSLMNWYNCLNGYPSTDSKYQYDWSNIKAEYRNAILAMLEETVLEQYYSIPTITQNTASMLGAKFSYASEQYNTFMGYGGFRYMTVNYTDAEWNTFVASKGGDLKEFYKQEKDSSENN